MIEFLASYNEWWIGFWLDHPILFWVAFVGLMALAFWPMIWRR